MMTAKEFEKGPALLDLDGFQFESLAKYEVNNVKVKLPNLNVENEDEPEKMILYFVDYVYRELHNVEVTDSGDRFRFVRKCLKGAALDKWDAIYELIPEGTVLDLDRLQSTLKTLVAEYLIPED
jgi:hypothetical protein